VGRSHVVAGLDPQRAVLHCWGNSCVPITSAAHSAEASLGKGVSFKLTAKHATSSVTEKFAEMYVVQWAPLLLLTIVVISVNVCNRHCDLQCGRRRVATPSDGRCIPRVGVQSLDSAADLPVHARDHGALEQETLCSVHPVGDCDHSNCIGGYCYPGHVHWLCSVPLQTCRRCQFPY
jgi:hypothetical protein